MALCPICSRKAVQLNVLRISGICYIIRICCQNGYYKGGVQVCLVFSDPGVIQFTSETAKKNSFSSQIGIPIISKKIRLRTAMRISGQLPY